MVKMGEKKISCNLALVLLCFLVVFFACAAAVFIGLYFVQYGEKGGKTITQFIYCLKINVVTYVLTIEHCA